MSVTLEHIDKYYGSQKALSDICFSLQEGEICGFLGPNGAGKSTTMKIITGSLTDYEGNVRIQGIDIRQSPLKAKFKIGYLPEHNPLYPDMYIREYLLHVARLFRLSQPRQRVERIIESTGLVPERTKKIGQLSKGYRQRVGLAQALIHDPEILILDEPMTGLDPNQLEEIRAFIKESGKNKTVLLSTHIMQEVEAICDRVMIIDRGSLIADKPIHELHSLVNDGMLLYILFAPDCRTEWIATSPLFAQAKELSHNHWQLSAHPGEDPRILLFRQAVEHDCPILELKTEDHKLEEIFHNLTRRNG